MYKLIMYSKRIYNKIIKENNKLMAIIIAFLSKITIDVKGQKEIWLIGGASGQRYIDNSATLHRYILENHPDIKIYWVINKNSADLKEIKENVTNKIVYKNSIKANVFALRAKVHIVSHGKTDISSFENARLKNAFKVHLGHGVHGLKKVKNSIRNLKSLNYDYDFHIANSEFEMKIKQNWGVDKEKIYITGMPRYDDLIKKVNQNTTNTQKKILYMPTWRDWLVDNQTLNKTKYFREITALLTNKSLNELLKSQDVTLNVCFHRNMKDHIKDFNNLSNTHIKILPIDIDLQNEIVTSKFLITDYSSICWDFLYINKPVIFFQFDITTYLKKRGAYLDLYNDLFGPVVYNSNDVIPHISSFINGFYYNHLNSINKDRMFKFIDENNCKRIMQVIFNNIQ